MKIGCIDTETTGLDTNNDKVVEFCIRGTEEPCAQVWRVNPGIPMPEIAWKTHGITDELVKDLDPLTHPIAAAWIANIQSFDVIMGYNVDFDIDILRAEFSRLNLVCRWPSTVVCLLKMWSHFEPRGLIDAYKKFVNPEGFEGAHGAAADVSATIEIFQKMLIYFGATEMALEDLNPQRKLWCGPTQHFKWKDETRTELIIGFGKNKSKPLHESDVGFLRWMLRNDFPDHVKRIVTCAMSVINVKDADLLRARDVIAAWARERDR